MQEIVRLCGKDLPGRKSLVHALLQIKGVSFAFAKAVVHAAGLQPRRKLGELSEEELKLLEGVLENPTKHGIPSWLLNRRKDYATGKDLHLLGDEVEITRKFDIQRAIEIKSWRGIRHMQGLPVRGRRLRGTFRRQR